MIFLVRDFCTKIYHPKMVMSYKRHAFGDTHSSRGIQGLGLPWVAAQARLST